MKMTYEIHGQLSKTHEAKTVTQKNITKSLMLMENRLKIKIL